MPRLSVNIPNDLKKRLLQYIANRYDTFYGKINEVVTQAIEEFLDKREEEGDGSE